MQESSDSDGLRYDSGALLDVDLLVAWRKGDNVAGSTLVQRHMRVLYRFFRTKVDRDVDELIQRTWLRCAETKSPFRGDSTFRTYLLGIGRNVALEYFRQRRRDSERIDPEAESAVDLGVSATTGLARKREHRLLLQGLRSIALDHQVALELFYWEDLTSAELAEILGVPPNTMRTRIRRARDALRKKLANLATSAELLESTQGDLEGWARSLRDYVDEDRKASAEP